MRRFVFQGLAICGSTKSASADGSRALGYGDFVNGEEVAFFPNDAHGAQEGSVYVGRDFSTCALDPPFKHRMCSLDPAEVKWALVYASICMPCPGCIRMRCASPTVGGSGFIGGSKVRAPELLSPD